jgi:putative phosphoesterase
MRIGLLADIHANLEALKAVLADMGSVDLCICAGDVTGYYADPNEVCALVRARGIVTIRGNHDAYVGGDLRPDPAKVEAYRTDWTRQALTAQNLEWLRALPKELTMVCDSRTLRVRHANPWDEEGYIYPDSAQLLQRISLGEAEVLVLGHTHRPMVVRDRGGLLVNPGSVGQPRDWNPTACYAILNTASGEVEIRRVAYDVAALQRRLRELEWDPTVIAILGRMPGVEPKLSPEPFRGVAPGEGEER